MDTFSYSITAKTTKADIWTNNKEQRASCPNYCSNKPNSVFEKRILDLEVLLAHKILTSVAVYMSSIADGSPMRVKRFRKCMWKHTPRDAVTNKLRKFCTADEVEVKFTTDSQSASPSWYQAPIWDPWPIFLWPWNFLYTVADLLFCSALSDERTGL
jgi:hypothetical protein